MKPRTRAELALVLVTLFWGITFPLIRLSVQQLSPQEFIALRFGLATVIFALLLSPLLKMSPPGGSARRNIAPGALLGLIAWITYQTQTVGLQTIGAGRAAFITGSCVLIVPFLSPLFGSGWPNSADWLASFVAGFGLYLLTAPQGGGGISNGDLWVFVCALGCAFYIQVLQKISKRGPNSTFLSFFQVATVALIGLGSWTFTGARVPTITPNILLSLGICAVFATVGTFWLQTRFQGETTAERAALIFTLEPVFGSLFGFLVLGETLDSRGALGAALILASIVGSELWKARRPT